MHLLGSFVDDALPFLNIDYTFTRPLPDPDVLFRPFPGISQVH